MPLSIKNLKYESYLKPALATEKTVVQTNPNKRNLFIVIAEL